MKLVMADLETLGVVPGCVGFSIGAVEFDPIAGTMGREFYQIINVDSCLDHYLRIEPPTEKWWATQSEAARAALIAAQNGKGTTLPDAMEKLNHYFKRVGKKSEIRLLGNGADFDNPILRVMYDAAKVDPYISAWSGRCYRTLKNLDELLGPEFKFSKLERQGTYHNALDDAKSQAQHLMDNIAAIRNAAISRGQE